MQNRLITTDLNTYNSYVAAGLWIPNGNPKYKKGRSAEVSAKVTIKPRRGEEPRFDEATITIENYYAPSIFKTQR